MTRTEGDRLGPHPRTNNRFYANISPDEMDQTGYATSPKWRHVKLLRHVPKPLSIANTYVLYVCMCVFLEESFFYWAEIFWILSSHNHRRKTHCRRVISEKPGPIFFYRPRIFTACRSDFVRAKRKKQEDSFPEYFYVGIKNNIFPRSKIFYHIHSYL